MINSIFTAKTRTLIYAVSAVFHAFALVYFKITEDTWQLWTSMILGLFDAVLAFSNTPVTNSNIKEVGNPNGNGPVG